MTVAGSSATPEAVLFDRDGTLIADVAYNGDPARVEPIPGAAEALALLRGAGIRTGVVTNQSAVARGLITEEQMHAVNARVEQLLGPFDVWRVCVHGPDDGCDCRKPAPGMILGACAELGVAPHRVVMVGDIAADIGAAHAAGARGVLIPNAVTAAAEVSAASEVAPDLLAATEALLAGDVLSWANEGPVTVDEPR